VKRLLVGSIGLLIVILWIALALSFTVDIDVNSGRVRHQTRIAGLVVAESVDETPFSEYAAMILKGEHSARWYHDRTSTLLNRVSPHYQYHGALYSLDEFLLVCDLARISDERKKEAAMRLMQLLRQGHISEIRDLNLRILNEGRKGTAREEFRTIKEVGDDKRGHP